MDSLRSFVRCARSKSDLLLRRMLFGQFSPVIHSPDDVAGRGKALGGSFLDVKQVSRKDFSRENADFSSSLKRTRSVFGLLPIIARWS